MVYDVNEGILYLSAAAPSKKKRADVVLTVNKDARGEGHGASTWQTVSRCLVQQAACSEAIQDHVAACQHETHALFAQGMQLSRQSPWTCTTCR